MANISFYSVDDSSAEALDLLQARLPEHRIWRWPEMDCREEQLQYAICWHPPETFFTGATQLKAIFSMAAGVDHLLLHPTLPENVPILRLCDAGMGDKIAEYVHYGVLQSHRGFDQYRSLQSLRKWNPINDRHAADYRVGVMGFGIIGHCVAQHLHRAGYSVSAYKRTKSAQTYPFPVLSDNINEFLSQLDVLVGVLPATPQTDGIFNREKFNALPAGAQFINVGRGSQVVDTDLLAALDSGQIKSALLDVFVTEPLPEDHRYWVHPGITVTPHIAGPTQLQLSVAQITESIRKLDAGAEPSSLDGLVDRNSGY